MIDLTNKIVLITGAAGGKGQQLAVELAGRGAKIAAVDINPLGLDETVQRIHQDGGTVKEYVYDIAKQLPAVALVEQVLDDWGRVDILVLAGEVHPTDPILTMDEWDFHRTLDVNLAGPFYLMQRAGKAMIQQGGGLIVVDVGNVAGEGAAYRASKAGLAALAAVAAQELARYNIQVMRIDDLKYG